MVLTHEDKPRLKLISDGRPWTSKLILIDEDGKEIDISRFITGFKLELDPRAEPILTLGVCGRYVDLDVMAPLKDCRMEVFE